jgi:5'-nucleotidase
MRILLTNDDGILAPGLAAMRRVLCRIGQVSVAAPDTVQSAAGHSITIRDPLMVKKVHAHGEFHGWAVAGRPADCVKLAIKVLLEEPPDLVVSGINDGANVSVNVLYSGTVAAAAEGAMLGVPSVAVSLEWGDEMHFERAAEIAFRLISCYANSVKAGNPLCPLLNINIPDLKNARPAGLKVVPQAVQRLDDHYEHNEGPDGLRHYWLRGWFNDFGSAEFDLRALRDGNVVLTPLHFDMTDHGSLERVARCQWPDVSGSAMTD